MPAGTHELNIYNPRVHLTCQMGSGLWCQELVRPGSHLSQVKNRTFGTRPTETNTQ